MNLDEALKHLKTMSAHFGVDPMLVQGAGGNVSAKTLDGRMYIKSSGRSLREVNEGFGWVSLPYGNISSLLGRYKLTGGFLPEADDWLANEIDKITDNEKCGGKASIETAMHAVLGRYVVHLHPVILNVILCSAGGKEVAQNVFSGISYKWIDVNPPGYYTARAIFEALSTGSDEISKVIFLANHGVIVHGDDPYGIVELYDRLIKMADSWFVGVSGRPIHFSTDNWSEELSFDDLFPDTVVFHEIAHGIDSLSQNKKIGIIETFAASRLIRNAQRAVGLKAAPLALNVCQYIQGMSREKHRQSEAKI